MKQCAPLHGVPAIVAGEPDAIDLAQLELDIPAAANARALAVFVDSYYELDVDGRPPRPCKSGVGWLAA